MIYWFKSRARAWPSILFTVVGLLVIGTGNMDLPVPRVVPGPVPAMLLLPAAMAAALVASAGAAVHVHEYPSSRPVALLDIALIAGVILVVVGIWVLISRVDASGPWLGAGRNLIGYTGIGLLTARLGDLTLGASAPVALAIAVSVLGTPDSSLWAWPIRHDTDPGAALVAAALLAAGGWARYTDRRAAWGR